VSFATFIASQLRKPVRALVLEWDVMPGTEIAKVTVEASEDLKAQRSRQRPGARGRVRRGDLLIVWRRS
jgi:hypothetical protein